MKCALMVLTSLLFAGCGGGSTPQTSTSPTAATSVWAGKYTGELNFSGCPSTSPCGGDSISVTVSEASDPAIPGQFLPNLAITGVDNTTMQNFTGTGTAVYTGAAPVGPGSFNTNATITTSLGDSLMVIGSGSVQNSSAIHMTTGAVHSFTVSNGVIVVGPYLGSLSRQ